MANDVNDDGLLPAEHDGLISGDTMDELQIAFDSLTTTGSIAVDDILEAMSAVVFFDKNPIFTEYLQEIKKSRGSESMIFADFVQEITNLIQQAWLRCDEDNLKTMFSWLSGSLQPGESVSVEDIRHLSKECGESIPDSEILEMIDITKAFVRNEREQVDVVAQAATGSNGSSCSRYVTAEEFLNFVATDEIQEDTSLNLSVEDDSQCTI